MIGDLIDAMNYSLDAVELCFRDGMLQRIGRKPMLTAKEIADNGTVIYHNNNTVLKVGGKTFVAKLEKGEKFDPEKGLLVCLVKALGLTTSDVLKLMDKAETKESKRKPNVVKQDKMNKKRK